MRYSLIQHTSQSSRSGEEFVKPPALWHKQLQKATFYRSIIWSGLRSESIARSDTTFGGCKVEENVLEEVTPELEFCSLNRGDDGGEKSISDGGSTRENAQVCKSEILGRNPSSATQWPTNDSTLKNAICFLVFSSTSVKWFQQLIPPSPASQYTTRQWKPLPATKQLSPFPSSKADSFPFCPGTGRLLCHQLLLGLVITDLWSNFLP